MSKDDKALLDLWATINKMESACRNLGAPEVIYKLLGELRNQLARWWVQ